ncbi:MAG: DUF4381 domain-containing protein [Methylococcus sp.]|nr:DUF4381 domain-containing protein [Methylococcus sp.]
MEPQLDLRDIHLPPPIDWWPPAPGWWLAPLLALALILTVRLAWRRFVRNPFRKAALRELAAIEADASLPVPEKIRRVSILLRRACLTLYPRQEVAGLTGLDWLERLDLILGDGRFSEGPGRCLIESPYSPRSEADPAALFALCREWIRRLPRPPRRPF